jgi:hypothetical protein
MRPLRGALAITRWLIGQLGRRIRRRLRMSRARLPCRVGSVGRAGWCAGRGRPGRPAPRPATDGPARPSRREPLDSCGERRQRRGDDVRGRVEVDAPLGGHPRPGLLHIGLPPDRRPGGDGGGPALAVRSGLGRGTGPGTNARLGVPAGVGVPGWCRCRHGRHVAASAPDLGGVIHSPGRAVDNRPVRESGQRIRNAAHRHPSVSCSNRPATAQTRPPHPVVGQDP